MRGWYPHRGWWPRGWWCPMHPWPPAWARWWHYTPPYHPAEELKLLEDLKKDLEDELADVAKRIEDLKRSIREGEQKP
ncbi:MAG: DUF5320 domain-containing protein [Candidatus Bathyarchaeia archaeon]